MRLSTEIGSAARIVGEERAIEYIARVGFDAWDFTMFSMRMYDWKNKRFIDGHPLSTPNYLEFVKRLKQVARDCGIVCNQAHAPFPSDLVEIDYLKRAIECAAEVGAEVCVVHPCNRASVGENAALYRELLPFAKQHHVKIAAENMWCWDKTAGHSTFAACATGESFLAHLEAVNDPYLVACLDLGHAEMRGSGDGAPQMIRALGGKHLKALHIHDNDLLHDTHQIPFSMSIDFAAVAEALREIRYAGDLTLEADAYLNAFDESNIFEGVQNLHAAVKRFADLFSGR